MSTLPPDAEAAWTALMIASRRALDAVEAALKAAGLPPLAWYDALLEIERAGRDGLRPFELKERLLLPQYATSRLLDRITSEGLLEKRPSPEDGRGFSVVVTPAGREMRAAMWPVYRDAVTAIVSDRLSGDDCADLARLLRKLGP